MRSTQDLFNAIKTRSWDVTTNLGNPGVDTLIPTEKAVRAAISTVSGAVGLVLLEQHAGAGVSTLDFTSGITGTYDEYILEVIDLLPGTNGAFLQLQMSTDGGATWLSTGNYDTVYFRWSRTGNSQSGNASDSVIDLCGGLAVSNDTTKNGLCSTIHLFNPGSTKWKRVTYNAAFYYSGTPEQIGATTASACISNSAINAVRFMPSSGTFTGTVRLYGISK